MRNEYNESMDEAFSRIFEKERATRNEVKIKGQDCEFNADSCIPRENNVILYLHDLIIGMVYYSEITYIGETLFKRTWN